MSMPKMDIVHVPMCKKTLCMEHHVNVENVLENTLHGGARAGKVAAPANRLHLKQLDGF